LRQPLKTNINAITTKFFPQLQHNLIHMVIVGCTDAINEIFGRSTDRSNMAFFFSQLANSCEYSESTAISIFRFSTKLQLQGNALIKDPYPAEFSSGESWKISPPADRCA